MRFTRPAATVSLLVCIFLLSGCNGRGGPKPNGPKIEARLAPVLNNNGVMLLEHHRGDVAGALRLFKMAVDADAKYGIGWLNLGIAYYIQRPPDGLNQAALARYTSYSKTGLDALDRAESLGVRVPNLYFTRGLFLAKAGDFAAAKSEFERVIAIDPADAFSHWHVGKCLFDQGKYAEALPYFEKAVKLLPNLQSGWNNLGQAYTRAGQPEKAKTAFARLSTLSENRSGVTVGGEYFAGVGRYIEPVSDSSAPKRAPGGPMVAFTDASTSAIGGLPAYWWKGGEQPAFTAAWGDYDNDTRPDLLLCQGSAVHLLHNQNGRLETTDGRGIAYPDGTVNGASWGDVDNDGFEDLLLFGSKGAVVFRNDGKGAFQRFGTARSIEGSFVHGLWVDTDHDGFLDILLIRSDGKPALFSNKGGHAFVDVTSKSRLSTVGRATYALPSDVDRNRAVDIIFVDTAGLPTVMHNNYDGTFSKAVETGLSSLARCRQTAAADLNSDGLIDYAAATPRGVQLVIRRPEGGFKVSPALAAGGTTPAISVGIADFDNDGNSDIVALSESSSGMGGDTHLSVYQGAGDASFTDATAQSGLDKIATRSAGRIALADLDSKGSTDIFVPGASPLLAMSGGNGNRWVRLNLRGLESSPVVTNRDGSRTNGSGLGALVEAWTDSTWTMTEITSAAGDDRQPIMGLGATSMPRWTRILWTSGVHECEPIGDQKAAAGSGVDFRVVDVRASSGNIAKNMFVYRNDGGDGEFLAQFPRGGDISDIPGPVNSTWVVWEPNRAPTSCPVLYTWDGKRYRFITDLQGGAIIGYNVGEYQYAPNDPDEYVMLPEGALTLKDGKYDVQIADQLQEILYIDAVHLLAVDHPASTRVLSNDRMKAAPPFPQFSPVSVDEVRAPKAVTGNRGQDLLVATSAIDRKYPEDFEKLKFHGFAERHTLTVDLGDVSGAKKVYLLLYGWQKYAHSSSNLAAAHAGVFGEPPSVQVQYSNGKWKTVIADMGAVAGLPKWLAVDLSAFVGGSRTSKSTSTKVRIVTNLELYWDKIEVGLLRESDETRVTRLKPESGDYRFLGYPKPNFPDGREPVVYDFDQRRDSAPWWTPAGYYTRPGDVTELLQKPDDMYVIMRHGHAINIRFDPSKLPALPPGWKRDFVLMSDGFGKDMDMNGATALTVGPLPFHKMTHYPYGPNERYPSTPAHAAYRRKYNTVYEPGLNQVARWPELRLKEN